MCRPRMTLRALFASRPAPHSTQLEPAGWVEINNSVVDTQLRVRGVDGLRIADNSIMPRLVSGNTNATAIMIGERAADFIKGNLP